MSKYLAVFKITWEQGLVYRLNFALWRVRSILQLLLAYFIWWTVFQNQEQIFGYTQSLILTYILVAALIRAIILSSRVMDVAGQINEGSIVNFLIKPLDFITYYFTRVFGYKLLNISFVAVEITMLIFLLKPQIAFQTDTFFLTLFILSAILGMILYFTISFILGMTAFWVENSWGPFFLLMIFLEGLGGGLFPIDILPNPLSQIILLTPFPYLIYFPSKLYLGTMPSVEIIQGFSVLVFWVITLWFLMIKTLEKGLKIYTAVGH